MSLWASYDTYGEAIACANRIAQEGYNVELFIYEAETWPYREVSVVFDVVTAGLSDGICGSIEEIDNR